MLSFLSPILAGCSSEQSWGAAALLQAGAQHWETSLAREEGREEGRQDRREDSLLPLPIR